MWGGGRVDTVCLGGQDDGGALRVRNWVQGIRGLRELVSVVIVLTVHIQYLVIGRAPHNHFVVRL